MRSLSDLIARVEGLEGPSFAAECAIFEALEMPREWFGQAVIGHFMDGAGYGFNTADGYRHHDCIKPPAYTASLDAALALVERVLPGWGWMVLNEPSHCENGCSYAGLTPPDGSRAPSVALPGKPPALALILALLRALAVKEER